MCSGKSSCRAWQHFCLAVCWMSLPCHSVAGGNVSVHQLITLIVQHISMSWPSLVNCINIPGCELGQPESRHTFPSANPVIRSCNFWERRGIKSWNNNVLNCFVGLCENLLVRTITVMFIFREGWGGVLFLLSTFYFCFWNLFESTRDRAERDGEKVLVWQNHLHLNCF